MSKTKLIKLYTTFGILGLLSIIALFVVEIDSFRIRNDDELMIAGSLGAALFAALFLIVLFRKMYLYGGNLVEKIITVLAILFLIFIGIILLFVFTFNINMI